MKTINKEFDAVKFMRQQRDGLSEKLAKMTKEEIIAYFKQVKTKTTIKHYRQHGFGNNRVGRCKLRL